MSAPLLTHRPLRRRLLDAGFYAVTALSALIGVFFLACILVMVASRGLSGVSWSFLTEDMSQSGAAGGIFYQLVGTLILVAATAVIVMPLAVSFALLNSEYIKSRRLRALSKSMLFLLNGVPSILFGVFGYLLFVKALGLGKSWLVGALMLAFMILPTVTVSVMEAIDRIPTLHREAAMALGLNPPKVIWSLVLPSSLQGLITGTLLGLGRAAGETAPIMFTAAVFSGVTVPDGVVDNPILAIPYHILNLAQDASSPEVLRNAWSSAFVLLALSLILNTLAWFLRRRAEGRRAI